MDNPLLQRLAQPDTRHRPIPFWSWNDALEGEELVRQVRAMKQSGVGGFFMHARGGLQSREKNPELYLSEEWFDCINLCIEEAKRQGIHPWIYDDEGWPSGFAGGKVTALGEWVYARGLQWRRLKSPEEATLDALHLGIYGCKENEQEIELLAATDQRNYCSYLELRQQVSPYYIDVLRADVMAEFLTCTHEVYQARCAMGEEGLRGFFTDEPRLAVGQVPWSLILPEEFQRRYGRALLPLLPALFFNCTGYERVRFQFWEMVNDLFATSYMKQLGAWCANHGVELTGHGMMEESLYSQMTGSGGNMPFYEYMQQPGVDVLRRNVLDPRIAKQVGSVAEQLGKEKVITESYALSGWNLSFEEMAWMAGGQYVNGVNLMCQHLQAYSLRGFRKRDYPPSLYYQQSWYDQYHLFNDYLARLGQLLTEGEKSTEVLMLHPMHSGWVTYDGTNNQDIKALDEAFSALTTGLNDHHVEHHYGDEVILARHGRVEGNTLLVGKMRYKVVVLPAMWSMDGATLALLERFLDQGGRIFSHGRLPHLLDGAPSERLQRLVESCQAASTVAELADVIKPLLANPVTVRAEQGAATGIHSRQLKLPEGRLLYLVNLNHDEDSRVTITLRGEGRVSELDLMELKQTPCPATQGAGETRFTVELPAMKNALYLLQEGQTQAEERPTAQILKPEGAWDITAMEDNALTLDCCEWSLDGSSWQPKTPVIHLMERLLDLKRPCQIGLRFRFNLDMEPRECRRFQLVLEQRERYQITCNGQAVTMPLEGHWRDISFQQLSLLPYIQRGENVVELSGEFYQREHVYDVLYGEGIYETELNKLTYDTELESIYLVGDFGVWSDSPFAPAGRGGKTTDGGFTLRAAPTTLTPGDFTNQGLLFFPGKITLRQTIRWDGEGTAVLDLGAVHAPLVGLQVNGEDVGHLLFAPWQREITPYLKAGENVVDVTVYASLRNLLGPHHHSRGELFSVGPVSFTGRFSWADRESEAVVITPEMRKQNFWTDSYCFVPFGL